MEGNVSGAVCSGFLILLCCGGWQAVLKQGTVDLIQCVSTSTSETRT